MKTRVALIICLICFPFFSHAQMLEMENWIDDWRGLSERMNNTTSSRFSSRVSRSEASKSNNSRRKRANFSSSVWNIGVVLMPDGSLLEGRINHNIRRDIIQIQSNDTTRILAAHQIQGFEILKDIRRFSQNNIDLRPRKTRFYSFLYGSKNSYARPKLFEVVLEGNNTSLLRRWHYGTRSSDRKLYLRNPEGEITQIKKRRGQVISSFDGKYDELREFAKRQRLDMFDLADVITLVKEYNKLQEN